MSGARPPQSPFCLPRPCCWNPGVVERARLAIRALMDLAPPTARCLHPHDGCVVEQRVDTVPIGTTILVRPGEKIPLDGTVTQGDTMVNQSPITGEAVPSSQNCWR